MLSELNRALTRFFRQPKGKTTMEFTTLSGKDLVAAYNSMVKRADELGIDGFEATARFASAEAGRKRCDRIQAAIAACERLMTKPKMPAAQAGETVSAEALAAVNSVASPPPPPADKPAKVVAPRKKAAATVDGDLATYGHKALTDAYNEMVPEALKLDIKAKLHTSAFITKEGGVKQIKALAEALRAKGVRTPWA